MTVKLALPFVFDCGPGEAQRVAVVAHAPLPAPMAQRFNLDRLVALSDAAASLDGWEIVELQVTDGQRIADVLRGAAGPVPAAVFACNAVGAEIRAPFGPGDVLTCAARNRGVMRSMLALTGVACPRDWLFFCLNCGASVWTANLRREAPEVACDACGAPMHHWEPRDRDAGPFLGWGREVTL